MLNRIISRELHIKATVRYDMTPRSAAVKEVLVTMQSNGSPHSLPLGMRNGAAAVGNS